MKNKKYFFHNIIPVVIVCLIVASCKKIIEVDPPVDQLTTGQVFESEKAATAAINGLYSEIMKNNNYVGNGAFSVLSGLSADEIIRTLANTNEDAFATNSLLPANTALLNNLWQKAYFHIYQANAIIENVNKSRTISEPVKNQLIGEAKFFRAFFHFYLANAFGNVPLAITSDYKANAVLFRSDAAAVYNQITVDLKDAVGALQSDYPTAEKVRVNKWAAKALLARVYIYDKDWAHAEAASSDVINSGLYQLAGLNDAFLPNNSEAILQFIPAITQIFNTSEGFAFLPFSPYVKPTYKLTSVLVNAFEASDQRKTSWVKTVTIGGVNYFYPSKYKVKFGSPGEPKLEYNIVLRLAEQYLIRAEARAHQNNLAGAQSDLNMVRTRAGLDKTTANDQAGILQAVENERQVELCFEWGHRWFDLKRTGRASAVLSVLKVPNWQATDELYPIPQAELLNNPNLTQNPGY